MEEIKNYIDNVILKIQQMSKCFYQQKNNQGYQELVDVIDCLNIIMTFLEDNKGNAMCVNAYQGLTNNLNRAMEAVSNKDAVLVADIFNYDMVDILKAINLSITKMEGENDHVL